MDRSYEVYRYYLALRLHFTTDHYDVVKQRGRVRASKQAFYKRRDLHSIKKVAENYSEKEIVDFLVANFTSGDRWGGVFDIDAKEKYINWKKRVESLAYTFEKELASIVNHCEKSSTSYHDCFIPTKNEHSYIIKMYLRKEVSIETLVILYQLNFLNYVEILDTKLEHDIVWPDLSRIIKKYSPFLTIEQQRYARILRRTIGCNEVSNN